ncbi:helix-turn-helix domain-containing protein [Mucilaginibacter myungsuensis]|uniref:Helix-turn-helix transcriptional regulator n=1 Tax=Mucilaginibacter myungsuensis TaxID=649104 RepID=A0A929KY22_9SPHI|nr:helix-turn-helix transcriptional regulator [Mucilaginibacter myungsuensis]MBE9662563.1 helix-turn-helix transcriptional regulator [Mucilaginibacter myungsuensis]MDN3597983.1 helix-turn-helix transcriptional regulator [Mucilaginibacter myungsuensis]
MQNQKDLSYINQNIRKLRERDFLSQEYMAAKMGIGQNAYSKIELGKTKITLDRLFAIADILGVTVIDLLIQERVELRKEA